MAVRGRLGSGRRHRNFLNLLQKPCWLRKTFLVIFRGVEECVKSLGSLKILPDAQGLNAKAARTTNMGSLRPLVVPNV